MGDMTSIKNIIFSGLYKTSEEGMEIRRQEYLKTFPDPKVFEDYLETVKNPKSMISRTREVELNKDSKILTLSTCIGNHDYRYLVQGVLVKDELTK